MLSKFPELVEIEPVNICNLRCEICERGNLDYLQDPLKVLSFEDFKSFIDSYDFPMEAIQFCGTGEPLLNPDLSKMVSYVVQKKKPLRVELITNGTLLNKRISRNLISAGLNSLKVSIDGPNSRSYESIRHYNFKKLKKNLVNFSKLNKNSKIFFGINCVINKLNKDDLPNMVNFARDVGAKKVEFRIFETNIKRSDLSILKKEVDSVKRSIKNSFNKSKIEFSFYRSSSTFKKSCNLFNEANINSNLGLTPCYHLPKYSLISLKGKLFSQVWNSKEVVSIRKKIKSKSFLKECCCDISKQ